MLMPADPESEVVFRVVQRIGSPVEAEDHIRELARDDPDWEEVVELAERHGVLSLLYEALCAVEPAIPGAVMETIRTRHRENALENLKYARHLHALVEAFRERDVRVIPYKGPAVAQAAYGDLSRRWFGDLDFLVAKDDLARARSVLRERGYEQTNFVGVPLAKLVDESVFRWERELRFVNEREGVDVELRPQFMGGTRSASTIFEELWRRRTSLSVAGRSLPSLEPEDRALLLLTHGTKHGWCRLSWACDVAMLLQRDVAWTRVVDRAAPYGWRTAVLLGLAVTAELADCDLPAPVRRAIADSHRATWGSSLLTTLFRTDPTGERLDLEPWTVILLLNDAPEGAVAELLDVAFSPRQTNHDRVSLPPALYPLYYLLRPPELLYNRVVRAKEFVGGTD